MISLIMGLPGAGKGTQADLIIEKYGIKHVSTGNIFRAAIAEGTDLGKELASYMDSGNLVPDELTINILKAELSKDEYKAGFLLDGFPRTTVQAEHLNEMLIDMNLNLDNIIYVNVAEDEIMGRLIGRLTCPNCGSTYHKTNVPPKVENICDKCGSKLITRADDTVESVMKRLDVAKSQTIPVVDFYRKSGKVLEIEASGKSVANVFSEITKSIG